MYLELLFFTIIFSMLFINRVIFGLLHILDIFSIKVDHFLGMQCFKLAYSRKLIWTPYFSEIFSRDKNLNLLLSVSSKCSILKIPLLYNFPINSTWLFCLRCELNHSDCLIIVSSHSTCGSKLNSYQLISTYVKTF